MLLLLLLLIPLIAMLINSVRASYVGYNLYEEKSIAFSASILNLLVSLVVWILFDFSQNQFQFVKESYKWREYTIYLGVDGLSIYFVLLTTIIMPIALLSNWSNISDNILSYVNIILLLETALLGVFLVLDIFLFYVFFESILIPLFLLIGLFGSDNKVRASYYLFLYTLKNQCIRAKFRASPKALTTKDSRETYYLAWLMSQGMVTSLKIIGIKWVIADLSQTPFGVCKRATSRWFFNI